jgi:hypothetical protein
MAALRPLVGDLRQVASVRRIVLDDGPERGVRALAFSTGGGLDFWVMADRSLDIGTLSWRGVQLGWQSPAGFRSPALTSPEDDAGHGFGRGFGGFLVTCGLDHIRQPTGALPLHGHLPHTPARIGAYGEDWTGEEPKLHWVGEIIQWRYGAECFRVCRRIEARIGGASLTIRDRVENIGPEPLAPALLYHFNVGYPLLSHGTTIRLDGREILAVALPDRSAPRPATPHTSSGTASSLCVIEAPASPEGACRLSLRYSAPTLPFLQLWRDTRPNVGVLSIEPCNVGRARDGSNEQAAMLAPGEAVSYEVQISVETLAAPTTAQDGRPWPK